MSKGRIVAAVVAVVLAFSVVGSIWRSLWATFVFGNPVLVGVMFVAVFLLGVFVGGMRD